MSHIPVDLGPPPPKGLRKALFEPGRYYSIPLTILGRTDLSASAKLVWTALAGHLGRDGTEVWPSVEIIIEQTGLSERTVQRGLVELTEANLLIVERQFGDRNRYRILQPQSDLFDPPTDPSAIADPRQIDTPVKLTPPSNCHVTPVKLTPPYKDEVLQEVRIPPTPPADGGACACAVSPIENRKSALEKIENAEEAVAHVNAAMRAAGRGGLSWNERRKVRREFADGAGAELIGRINAEAVRGAVKATPADRTFAWGWLLRHVGTLAAADNVASAQREQAHMAHRAQRDRESAEEARRQADARARAAHFAALPEAEKDRWRDQARAGALGPKRGDVIEARAAAMAWKDAQGAEAAQ